MTSGLSRLNEELQAESDDDEDGVDAKEVADAGESKWWHVPDDQIEQLVRSMSDGTDDAHKTLTQWHKGQPPKPLRSALWGENVPAENSTPSPAAGGKSPKITPQDALDEMLRRMAEREMQGRSANATEHEVDGDDFDFQSADPVDSMEPMRPQKWWHVSDRKIRDMISTLRKEDSQQHRSQTGLGAMRATIAGTNTSTSSSSPKHQKIHVRLHALSRSEPIPCHRTGRRHRAAPKGELLVPCYVRLVDTGTVFSLNVHPDLRIGPDQAPPANRFTEQFGLGACTNGFDLKAQSFDYRYRRWANNPRPNWIPSWTESLKGQIELASGIEASRQILFVHGCLIGNDFTTVRTAGITPGVELQLRMKKDENSRDQRDVVLASTARKRDTEAARQALDDSRRSLEATIKTNMSTLKGELSVDSPTHHAMPPWKTQTSPQLFGGKDEGRTREKTSMKPAVPAFETVPIFRSDIQDSKLQRVRSLPCYTFRAARW